MLNGIKHVLSGGLGKEVGRHIKLTAEFKAEKLAEVESRVTALESECRTELQSLIAILKSKQDN